MIPVTKPFLPPKDELFEYIDHIYNKNWLTNHGPLVSELELRLKDYLGLKHILLVANGTLGLQIAIKGLGLKGEVVTTPFSYVATTSSLVWENCEPVFVDIDRKTLNIDPSKIEEAITPNTTGILATHVFGNPCHIDEIKTIARKHNLKVIYDAAHCFGTQYKGQSVFNYGDLSIVSFHATKLFHTVEGGAVIANTPEMTKKLSLLRNFGHINSEEFDGVGTNAKVSEFHAAMGLSNMKYADDIIAKRKELCEAYDEALKDFEHTKIKLHPKAQWNYSYYPIIVKSEEELLRYIKALNGARIFPRRYFYPSLNSLNYVRNEPMPVSEDISKRVMCLPLYHNLDSQDVGLIARYLIRTQKY